MKNLSLLIREMKLLTYHVNPHAKLLDNAKITVSEFFKPVYEYRLNRNIFPESDILKEMIVQDVSRIYGKEKGNLIRAQLNKHFMAETATHYSFPKSFDNFYGVDFDSNLTWNAIVISVAMSKYYKQSLHLGIYVTDIPFSSANSPSVIEISPDISAKVHLSGDISKYVEWYNLSDSNYYLCTSKLKKLTRDALIDSLICAKNNEVSIKTINRIKSNNISLEKVFDIVSTVGGNEEIISRYRKIIQEVETVEKSFNKVSDDFFNKTIRIHKKMFDDLINSDKLGVEQITLSNQTVIRFLVNQLRDRESWWYAIFNNPSRATRFVEELAGVRSGWNKTNVDGNCRVTSPFHKIIQSEKKTIIITSDFVPCEHTPEILISGLEKGDITPTCAMLIVIYLSVGFLPMGGPLQSIYAKDIQQKFCDFLYKDGETEKADEIKGIPVEISLHTSAFDCKDNMGLYNYSELKAMHDLMPSIIKNIPEMKIKHAHMNALPTLYNFYTHYVIERSHPDYRRCVINQKKSEFLKGVI